MKVEKGAGAAKAAPTPNSGNSAALKQAADALRRALEAVEACMGEEGEEDE